MTKIIVNIYIFSYIFNNVDFPGRFLSPCCGFDLLWHLGMDDLYKSVGKQQHGCALVFILS